MTRSRIIDAVVELLERDGVDAISTRSVGSVLGVHPTALYRHFRDMDEVLRAAADQVLNDLLPSTPLAPPDSATALDEVQQLCRRLRALLMAHPGASRVMAPGPSQAANERAFTERVLHLLNTAGLTDQDTALAYHALVEYVVGSATIDTDPRGGPSADKEQQHEAWRLEYARSAPEEFPATTRLAQWLYPSQEAQFDFGLELLIQSVRVRAESSPQRS